MVEHTVEIYKIDGRISKRKGGRRFIEKIDFDNTWSLGKIQEHVEKKYPKKEKFISYVHETYVTRVNLMSGKEFKERYDTPIYCSPAFESYWSM
tara:strand:+ start:784 stop:1065 length:282 start_codon:yes stop_codon:yes gene_type:complete